MRYNAQERDRMEYLLTAFGNYIRKNRRFDIVYSGKAGYIKIPAEEDGKAVHIRDANALTDLLINEIAYDSMLTYAYTGLGKCCDDPAERARDILYSLVKADEETLEKLYQAILFIIEPLGSPRKQA